MNLPERIAEEAHTLPDELAREVLDFILFLEHRYATEKVARVRAEPDWSVIHINTCDWQFDRDEANAR